MNLMQKRWVADSAHIALTGLRKENSLHVCLNVRYALSSGKKDELMSKAKSEGRKQRGINAGKQNPSTFYLKD